MVSPVLLDTDACIEIIRGNPEPLDHVPDARVVISTVSRFEIISGLRGVGSRKRERRAREFLEAAETLPFDSSAADKAASVRIFLERKGTPIGAYDLLLAGQALAMRSPILTRNRREFSRVPGLEIYTW